MALLMAAIDLAQQIQLKLLHFQRLRSAGEIGNRLGPGNHAGALMAAGEKIARPRDAFHGVEVTPRLCAAGEPLGERLA